MLMTQGVLRHIAKSTTVVASATALSRILGLVRDLLMAQLFGTTAAAQAFVVAFRLPNMLRDLVAEGAMASAVVPVLTQSRTQDSPQEFWRLTQALLTQLFVWLGGLAIVGVLAAPLIVRAMAPGFVDDPEKLALTVTLTRILFPLMLLVGLWAYFMGLLNTLRHFAVPALGPAVLNVAMIVACVWWVPRVEPGIIALAVGVMVGGALQVGLQLPMAWRLGFRYAWRWRHAGSSRVLQLLGPRTVGSAAHQANVLIHTALASLAMIVGEGAVASLYFANRLLQLPLALFGTATAQASLPALSEQAAHADWPAFRSTLLSVLRMTSFIMLPATVGLILLATPIVQGLFERGAFDRWATSMTARALIGYTFGLLAYGCSKLLSGAFYALHDTWTPVRLAIEAVVINIALSLALMGWLQVAGLALASSLASWLNAIRLLRAMERRLAEPLLEPLRLPLLRMGTASLIMGGACWVLWQSVLNMLPAWVGLPAIVLVGVVGYMVGCAAFGVTELATTLRWLIPRRLPSLSVNR